MTGQLAIQFTEPIPETRRRPLHRSGRGHAPPLRKTHMWWRGRKRPVTNVPITGGVL